jgi:outer membrane receptor protein involved in Fe transport
MNIKCSSIYIKMTLTICMHATSTYSQNYSLKGKIINTNNRPMELMNIILMKNDSIKAQEVTNNSGLFSINIQPGKYIFLVQQLGKVFSKKELLLDKDTDLGELKFEESVMLKGVEINSRKKMLEQKIDRMVFNVENSVSSQGMDGAEALRNTPLVKIDENNGISIIGKSSVSIMINDRIVNMAGEELVNYLKSLRSDNISKIEVITTPPSKYDAQGNSGIINIVLKKNTNQAWSANLSTAYIRKSKNGYLNNLAFNYQSERINSSLKVRQFDRDKQSVERSSILGTSSLFSEDRRLDMNDGIGLNYSLDYKLSKKSDFGIIYDFGTNNINMNINNESTYKTGTVQDSILTTYAEHRYKTPSHTVNLFYDLKLDSLGKKVSFGGNYFSNKPANIIGLQTENQNTNVLQQVKNSSNIRYNIWSGQADLTLPNSFAMLEFGIKTTYFNNSSDIRYFDYQNEGYVLNNGNSNQFEYKEQNHASYISIDKKLNDRWAIKTGLRYEYSSIDGLSLNTNNRTKSKYGKWFPTAYASYKLNDFNSFNLNYSRRINRPSFRAIDPYRWYINPYSYVQGNPLLKPSYNNNFEFSFSHKNKLTAALYYQLTQDAYTQVITYNEGIKVIGYDNVYDQRNIGLNLGYYETLMGFWDLALIANVFHNKSTATSPLIIGQKSFAFYYKVNNTFSLNKARTQSFMINFEQSLPSTMMGNFHSKGYYILNFGAKSSFIDKKLQLNILFDDVLKSFKSRGYSEYNGYQSTMDNYYDSRTFTISLSYSLGNSKVKGDGRKAKFDDKNRTN